MHSAAKVALQPVCVNTRVDRAFGREINHYNEQLWEMWQENLDRFLLGSIRFSADTYFFSNGVHLRNSAIEEYKSRLCDNKF